MYIIYCEHIFVYIFPCYFKGDSSFVTEVFSKKKEKKRKIIFPCKLRHFVTALSVWGIVDEERLTDLHWKIKSGRAGTKLRCSNTRCATLTNSPASLKHRRGIPDPGWLPFKMAQKADKSNSHSQDLLAGGSGSLPFLKTGPAQSRIRDWEVVAASVNWKEDDVKSLETSCCRNSESRLTAFSFLTLLHWLRVCPCEANYF